MDFNVSILGAFVAGLLSFLSPCVIPLVPPYLCFLAGVSFDEFTNETKSITASVFRTALAFVLGFTTVFVMLGATASFIGQALTRHLDMLSMIAGAIIIVMGLHFLGVLRFSWLLATKRIEVGRKPPGMVGGYLVGLAFAFGWTPCVGPVLAAILFLAASNDTAWQGVSLLLAYSLGIGLPFLAAALFAQPFLLIAAFAMAHAAVRKVGEDGLHKQPWFAVTFKDVSEDITTAKAAGKRLAIIIEQRGCIYCKKLHETVFSDQKIAKYIADNFMVVQYNMFGDEEVIDTDGATLTEKVAVRKWGMALTPTILFLPEDAPKTKTAKQAAVMVMPGAFGRYTTLHMFQWVREKGYLKEEPFQKSHARKLAAAKAAGK